jgi:hypothetical protein
MPAGLTGNTPYCWRIRFQGRSPFFPTSPWFSMAGNGQAEADLRTRLGTTAVSEPRPPARHARFTLVGPNPCHDRISIGFALDNERTVSLIVVDATGRKVAVLADGATTAGEHRLSWDRRVDSERRAASGVYIVRLQSGNEILERKIILTD